MWPPPNNFWPPWKFFPCKIFNFFVYFSCIGMCIIKKSILGDLYIYFLCEWGLKRSSRIFYLVNFAGQQYSGFDFEFSNRSKIFVFQVRGLIFGIRGYIGNMFKGNKWKLIFQSYTGIQIGGLNQPPPGQSAHFQYAGLNRVKNLLIFFFFDKCKGMLS